MSYFPFSNICWRRSHHSDVHKEGSSDIYIVTQSAKHTKVSSPLNSVTSPYPSHEIWRWVCAFAIFLDYLVCRSTMRTNCCGSSLLSWLGNCAYVRLRQAATALTRLPPEGRGGRGAGSPIGARASSETPSRRETQGNLEKVLGFFFVQPIIGA